MSASAATVYQSGSHSVVYVTVPDEDKGRELARKLVSEKLAACVNIVPAITSVYEWQGKIEEDKEAMLVIKTGTDRVDALTAFVKTHHPYDVPEVISMLIDNGNPDYLRWLGGIVKPEAK